MDKNNYLYYQKKVGENEYSYIPQGILNVTRLLQGKPYWQKLSSSIKKQQKTLILADWTAENWSSQKTKQIVQWVSARLKDGFTIYLRQKEGLVPLMAETVNMLHEKDVRNNITPIANVDLMQAVRKYHLH